MFKSILACRKVIVYGHSSSAVSTFIFSILGLFPAQLFFDFYAKALRPRLWELRELGLPLRLFHSRNPLHLSFGINDIDLLAGATGFLIGTTNLLIKDYRGFKHHLVVNLATCTLERDKPFKAPLLRDEAALSDQLGSWDQGEGFWGSDDWIREKFHEQLKQSLLELLNQRRKLRVYAGQCRAYLLAKQEQHNSRHVTIEGFFETFSKPSVQFNPPFPGLLSSPALQLFLCFSNEQLVMPNQPAFRVVLSDGRAVLACPENTGLRPPYATVGLGEGH